MLVFLTLLTIAIISTLLYGEVPPEFREYMQIAAVATPSLLLVLQMLALVRKGNAEDDTVDDKAHEAAAAAVGVSSSDSCNAAVVQFLARLQEKGRLVDFIMDDIAAYDNESVGAAARIVHQGCCEVIKECFTIEAVHPGAEMEEISLADNYDSNSYRLVGRVPDSAPFNGQVQHRGWKTTSVKLPQVIEDGEQVKIASTIIAAAEVVID